jgi:hypothetical protein
MLINLSLSKILFMEVFLFILYFMLFSWMLKKIPFFKDVPGLSYRMLLLFFILKILAGISMIWVYTHYYDLEIADFHKYFRDGLFMKSVLHDNPPDFFRMITGIDAPHLSEYYKQMPSWNRSWDSPVFNDNRIMIRFNALIALISGGYLYVHSIIINFLSLSGLIALYKFFERNSKSATIFWLPWGIFLFPSLLFWGSGVLKESLLLAALGFWVYFTDDFVSRKKYTFLKLLAWVFLTILLLTLKVYTFLLLLPCLIAFYWSRKNKLWIIQLKYFSVFTVLVLFALLLGNFFPAYDVITLIVNKQNDFVNFVQYENAGSILHTRELKPEIFSFLREFSAGIYYGFFRPHLFEAYSPVVALAAIENFFIGLMILYILISFQKSTLMHNNLIWLALWFSILLMGFVGMITPVHGAIVRYKIPALPFLWIFFVHMARLPETEKIRKSRLWRFFNK